MTGRKITTIFFDLDDTLMVEMASEEAAFLAACATAQKHRGVDPARLYQAVRTRAEELWRASGAHEYGDRIGFVWWEGMWSTFEGRAPELKALREWRPTYHHEAWNLALADLGVDDPSLADELSNLYQRERMKRHVVFDETKEVLEDLRPDFRLAMLTNGAEDIQQRKIDGSGLAGYFEEILITGAVGIGKPDTRPFQILFKRMGVNARETAMVGDSLSSDVKGALNAGALAVWLNRDGSPAGEGFAPDVEIRTLGQLRGALERLP